MSSSKRSAHRWATDAASMSCALTRTRFCSALHRALDHIADAKLPADLLGVDALAPVSERRPGRDHEKLFLMRDKSVVRFSGDPVGEVILVRVTREIGEGSTTIERCPGCCGRGLMEGLKQPDGYRRDYAQGSNAHDERSQQRVPLRERERPRVSPGCAVLFPMSSA